MSFGLLGNEDFLILRFCLLFFPDFFSFKEKRKRNVVKGGGCLTVMLRSV